MKYLSLLALGVCCLIYSGCDSVDSVPRTVREKFTGPTYRTRVFPADSRKAYEACRAALAKINFRFIRGGPAQGQIEALSGISSADTLRSARQLSLDVRLSPAVDGGTEVGLLFSEVIEDDSVNHSGLGTTSPLHDSALYEVYYRYIQEALAAAPK